MDPCPKIVGNAQVIFYTAIDFRHHYTGNTKHTVNLAVVGPVARLAVCKYNDGDGFYLFGCDEKWNVITDTWHESIGDAQGQAEFEYEGSKQTWLQSQ